jgi:hypothetical protein
MLFLLSFDQYVFLDCAPTNKAVYVNIFGLAYTVGSGELLQFNKEKRM